MGKLSCKWVVALAWVALFAGCTANTIGSARASLDRAKAAGAEAKAPMEYYMAEEYLVQAEKEQVGDGDRKQGRIYAEKSLNYSAEAIRKAGGGAK